MNKSLIAALATAATLLAAGTARAGNVNWSIGINLPPVGTVISNGPIYAPVYSPPPVVYAPPPVVYAPPPVIYQPVPRVVYPAPVVVSRPVPIVYGEPYYGHRHRHGRDWGDRDRDGIPNWKDGYDNRRDYYDRDYRERDRDYRDDRKYRH